MNVNDQLDLEILVLNLFKDLNKPLYLKEIYNVIHIFKKIEIEDLKNTLLCNSSFESVEFGKWALSEWDQSVKINITFDNYIEYINNNLKENHWKCFEDYYLTDTKETYLSIGEKLNITRQRVLQIINKIVIMLNDSEFKKYTDYFIKVLKEILNDKEYILIDNSPEEYKKVFGNWSIKKIVTFLNMMGGDFICYKDKYFICNEMITKITNVLEKNCSSLGKEQIKEAYIDDILKIKNLKGNLELNILLDCIAQDTRYLLCNDYGKVFCKKHHMSMADILYIIFHNLKKPATNSFLSEEFKSLTGKSANYDSINVNIRRDHRFVEFYPNIYGLRSWKVTPDKINIQDVYDIKEKNHKKSRSDSIVNMVIDVLSEHQGSMTYHDIYSRIKAKTSVSKHYMRKVLDKDSRIQELLSGYYKLRDTK